MIFLQAETEELGRKVETLNAENVSLKSELNRLTENSEKLRLENAKLMVYRPAISAASVLNINMIFPRCNTFY